MWRADLVAPNEIRQARAGGRGRYESFRYVSPRGPVAKRTPDDSAADMTDPGRAQDQGRKHTRRGRPSAATRNLLTAWHGVLRSELAAIVAALEETKTKDVGLGLTDPDPPSLAVPLEDPRRDRYITRGVAIARELGQAIDPPDAGEEPGAPATTPRRRRGRVDFGGA